MEIISRFPNRPGTYALFLTLENTAQLTVGRLGACIFSNGYYLYLGSAHGPGGLRGRLRHHLMPLKSRHWHLDVLRQAAIIKTVGYTISETALECAWSREAASLAQVSVPMPGFGASDCIQKCPAHLYYSTSPDLLDRVKDLMAARKTEYQMDWVDLF